VRILLDTHALLWFYRGDRQLSNQARMLIENPGNTTLISPATYWELAIKVSLGKYGLMETFQEFIQHAIFDNNFAILPIEPSHAACLATLTYPSTHKDPFDRLLIAQAISEQIPIVSADQQFDVYPVKPVW